MREFHRAPVSLNPCSARIAQLWNIDRLVSDQLAQRRWPSVRAPAIEVMRNDFEMLRALPQGGELDDVQELVVQPTIESLVSTSSVGSGSRVLALDAASP